MDDYIAEKCREIKDFIDNNIKHVKGVKWLADKWQIDVRKFSETFTHLFGCNPERHIIDVRKKTFDYLVKKYNGKNMGAAFYTFEIGFNNTSTFYKFIKTEYGDDFSIVHNRLILMNIA